MKTIFKFLIRVVATILFYGLLTGCGDNEPAETVSGAAFSACSLPVGVSVTYEECGGKALSGVYCVTGCVYTATGAALPDQCTLSVYGPPEATGVCVASCSLCK